MNTNITSAPFTWPGDQYSDPYRSAANAWYASFLPVPHGHGLVQLLNGDWVYV
jgi:hypothetical protein